MGVEPFDVAIIGGGVIGTSSAMALALRGVSKLLLLEAEPRLAFHQTGNNSGVIHSGLYYKPGSQKATNCVIGRERLYQFCQQHAIPHDRCGKVVIATEEAEITALDELVRRGEANGLKGLRRLRSEEIQEFEPHAVGVGGLHVPETGIVDYIALTEKYAAIAAAEGATIRTDVAFKSLERRGEVLIVQTTGGEFTCKNLIGCCGLQADRVARACGQKVDIQIVPFRGEYFELVPERTSLVRNLIYPVPDPQFPFLGVHFTRMIKGGVEAGPNAVLSFGRHGYKRTSFNVRDTWQMGTYPGLWKMAWRYWRTGVKEMHRSWSKKAFLKSLQKLIPTLRGEDIQPAGAGVRAQALGRDGKLVDDFCIVEDHRMIHVLNAPSPAATASLSIGETISDRAIRQFNLDARSRHDAPTR